MTPAPWDDKAARLHCLKLALRHLNPPSADDAVREAETLRRYWLGVLAADDPEAAGEKGEVVVNDLPVAGLGHGCAHEKIELVRDGFLAVAGDGSLNHDGPFIGCATTPMMAKEAKGGNALPSGPARPPD